MRDARALPGRCAPEARRLGAAGVAVTDTVPIGELDRPDKLTVLTISGILAETIENVFADESVSAIFAGENQLF